MKKNSIGLAVNTVYIIMVLLFVSDELTRFEIQNETIKLFVFYGIIFSTAPILIWNYLTFKPRFIAITVPLLLLVMIFVIGPTKILLSSNAWETQTILYKKRGLNRITIEYQTKGMGTPGFSTRTIQVTYLTDLFALVDAVPTNIDSKTEWIKVNIQTNTVRLKY